jgi:hypothetical protein
MDTDLFIITSVIKTGNQPWSYTSLRSCFTTEQRFEQTLQTIKSIRDLNDNTKILLVECSDINEEMTSILKDKVDYFIQTYVDERVRNACLQSDKKGFGEVMKLKKACDFIKENNIVFKRLFKISGRYFLDESFNKSNYKSDSQFTFKMYYPNCGSTVLYSVPYSLFNFYIDRLIYCISVYENGPPTGLETLIPCICLPKQEISTLGVRGNVAVLNDKGVPDHYIG